MYKKLLLLVIPVFILFFVFMNNQTFSFKDLYNEEITKAIRVINLQNGKTITIDQPEIINKFINYLSGFNFKKEPKYRQNPGSNHFSFTLEGSISSLVIVFEDIDRVSINKDRFYFSRKHQQVDENTITFADLLKIYENEIGK